MQGLMSLASSRRSVATGAISISTHSAIHNGGRLWDDGTGLKSEAPSLFFIQSAWWAPCPPALTRRQKKQHLMALVNNQPFLVVSRTVWSHADYRQHPLSFSLSVSIRSQSEQEWDVDFLLCMGVSFSLSLSFSINMLTNEVIRIFLLFLSVHSVFYHHLEETALPLKFRLRRFSPGGLSISWRWIFLRPTPRVDARPKADTHRTDRTTIGCPFLIYVAYRHQLNVVFFRPRLYQHGDDDSSNLSINWWPVNIPLTFGLFTVVFCSPRLSFSWHMPPLLASAA